MPLPKELCLNRYNDYVCLEAANHTSHHLGTNANGRTATWVHVKSPIEVQLESALANGESYRLANMENAKTVERLRKENSELNTKIKNQAKSLTEMHKANLKAKRMKERYNELKMQYSSNYGKSLTTFAEENLELRKLLDNAKANYKTHLNNLQEPNTDLIAERNDLYNKVQRNKNLQERLDTALQLVESNKASYDYHVKSYEESITNLKNRIIKLNNDVKYKDYWKRLVKIVKTMEID